MEENTDLHSWETNIGVYSDADGVLHSLAEIRCSRAPFQKHDIE